MENYDNRYCLKLGLDGYWFLYCSGIEVFSFHDDELSKHQVPDTETDRLWFALHLYQGYF